MLLRGGEKVPLKKKQTVTIGRKYQQKKKLKKKKKKSPTPLRKYKRLGNGSTRRYTQSLQEDSRLGLYFQQCQSCVENRKILLFGTLEIAAKIRTGPRPLIIHNQLNLPFS